MAKDKLVTNIMRQKDSAYIVHYSCQNLNDDIDGCSPRITSIAVLHLKSNQMTSFSAHTIAEELKIAKEKITHGESFDKIETVILKRFFSFACQKGEDVIWLHWNMRSVIFGFEHLEHRFRVLTEEEPYHIEEKNRYNISSLLNHKYGSNYAEDPKMQNLMMLNDEKHRDFLTGSEEVSAFKANEFVKMHKSTMCKVYFFKMVLYKMYKNRLRTKNNQWRYKLNQLYQHPFIQILGIIGIIGTLVSVMVWLVKFITG